MLAIAGTSAGQWGEYDWDAWALGAPDVWDGRGQWGDMVQVEGYGISSSLAAGLVPISVKASLWLGCELWS